MFELPKFCERHVKKPPNEISQQKQCWQNLYVQNFPPGNEGPVIMVSESTNLLKGKLIWAIQIR